MLCKSVYETCVNINNVLFTPIIYLQRFLKGLITTRIGMLYRAFQNF